MSFPSVATTAYDEVRYSNHPYAQTHPERLAIVARMHGLDVPRPSTARVLEFACGAGANLLGMAYAYPEMTGVGVDLAHTAIADAQETAEGVGLDNVTFRHGDVCELTDGSLGEFDYVIAHGLYAWVPKEVQDGLLAAVKAHLAPNGIAYISYNAMPGGHIRTMIREMGLFHVRDVEGDDVARGTKARDFFEWLALRVSDDAYGKVLEWELPALVQGDLARIVHDDFSPNWSPVYFTDFMKHAARHGLEYVGEAATGDMTKTRWPEGIEDKINEIAGEDRITREQYGDFLLCRRFRMTLLCHEGRGPVDMPRPEFLKSMSHQTHLDPADVEDPELAGIVGLLSSEYPRALHFDEIVERMGLEPDDAAERLLRCFDAELIGPQVDLPPRAGAPGERPRASELARFQCARGDDYLTTLTHSVIHVNEPEARAIIPMLDGTKTAPELHAALEAQGFEVTLQEIELGLRHLGQIGVLHE